MFTYDLSYIPHNSTIGIFGLGYIGSNIVDFLKRQDVDVNFILLNRQNWKQIIFETEFDYFINATGFSGNFREEPIKNVEANIHLTIDLLNNLKVKQVYLSLSSSRVYGFSSEQDVLFSEESTLINLVPENIGTLYDGAKILMESIVFDYARRKNFKAALVRLSNAYGRFNNLDDATLIKKLVRLSATGEPCDVNLNLLSEKNYVYIDDAVDGILRALFLATESDTYNIGSKEASSIEKVGQLLNVPIQGNDKLEKKYSNISISKANNRLGYLPKYDIETGLFLIKEKVS